ncbi:MAG: magnesium and cobalt transport protein CorA [Intrasporangium sp.]|uniref:magnesium and cobalt transport protein CorA n=1 Tax=Intrasporangium sp. TaxID=1925024 RepID=UPI003F7E713B
MDQAIYRDGRRHPCAHLSDELDRLREGEDGFLWIGLKDPTDEEFGLVNRQLHLHPLAVEDAVKGHQRPKIEQYESSLFVVLKTLRYIDRTSDIETGELMLFIGERFVVTVRRGEGNPLAAVRQALESDPSRLQFGTMGVLHAVMDSVVDNYRRVDREIQHDLEQIEQDVFGSPAGGDANVIYRLKREVLEFRRADGPLAEGLKEFMARGQGRAFDTDLQHLFRDVEDHLRQVGDHVDAYDRLLSDVLNAHLAGVSVQQNEDMRKISAWVAMGAVPTLIAGIYGMNFHSIPELDWSLDLGGHEIYFGYFLVLCLMGGIVFTLYRLFKRSGWL